MSVFRTTMLFACLGVAFCQPGDYPSSTYNYLLQGIDWPGDSANYNWSCDGMSQSPINVVTTSLKDKSSRTGVSGVDIGGLGSANLGGSVTIAEEQAVQITFQTLPEFELPRIQIPSSQQSIQSFAPAQLHFHHFASEHTVDGKLYPLEAHLVTVSQMPIGDGGAAQLAVLGVLYEYGPADPFLDRLFTAIDNNPNGAITLDMVVGTDILPSNLRYAGYDGSLTTPPCDERVKWHVFLTPRTVSREQMRRFSQITLGAHSDAVITNNRIIQPLNGRSVYAYDGSEQLAAGTP